ncbi:MAG: TIGR03749 family integrating conjugative element protein, partial [Burkholderiales bacterium]|nr:TIGR03749 family integrating conjugative element protein [Burkholderiales bacterium]
MKHRLVTLCACLFACLFANDGVHAADAEEIQPTRAAAFTNTVRDAQASGTPVELGEPSAALVPDPASRSASSSAPSPSTRKTTAAPTRANTQGSAPKSVAIATSQTSMEHVTFNRRPVRVALPVDRERLITFPSAVALQAPAGHEGMLRLEIIGRTVYATALAPFGSMRVIAEDIENDGVQIPMDFVADGTTSVASPELEIHLPSPGAATGGSATSAASDSADMVTLTRYAARALYAPRRLVPADASIRQVAVATNPVLGLYRGARVQTTPVGAWRSGNLYLTAVRITNQEKAALELQMDELRGQ